ncbi:MAG: DUF4297 domain-containing protein [Planctomycetota bacterium]
MNAPLKEQLVSVPPREVSGSTSSNRFDYQDDWALCKILACHQANANDFVLVLDFHDDVILLDSASDPTEARFFQVKTQKSGFWSVAKLIYRKSGKDKKKLASILGKLVADYLAFPNATVGLVFVSNVYSNFKLEAGGDAKSKVQVKFSEICSEDRTKFTDAMKTELPSEPTDDGLMLFEFECSELSLLGHADHTLGVVTNFLENHPEADTSVAAAFYRTLKGEISRRSKSEKIPGTFEELCKTRAVDRAGFESMLSAALGPQDKSAVVRNLRDRLNAENTHFGFVTTICNAASTLLLRRFDQTNRFYTEVEDVVGRIVDDFGLEQAASVFSTIETLYPSALTAVQEKLIVLSEIEIKAIIGVCLIEKQELPRPHQKP